MRAPTTSGGTTFGPGSANNLLKSNGTSVYWSTLATSDIPTISITDKTSGTLTVARGGTGATSFTANSLIMSGSSTTAALTTRAITNNTSNTAITNSNTNIPTMNTIYYGLVTVNNASQSRATGIYAPTSAGTANQILVSSGGTSAPTWKATASGAAYATSANGALTFGALPVAQGGTGATTADGAKSNLGFLKSTSDTLTGTLTVDNSIEVKNNSYPNALVKIYSTSEGGNIRIVSQDGSQIYEMDSHANDYLRLYTGDTSIVNRIYWYGTNVAETNNSPAVDGGTLDVWGPIRIHNKNYAILNTGTDLTASDNGNTNATGGFYFSDAMARGAACFWTNIKANGEITAELGVRDETKVSNPDASHKYSGLRITSNKSGVITYSISSWENFVDALSATLTMARGNSSYVAAPTRAFAVRIGKYVFVNSCVQVTTNLPSGTAIISLPSSLTFNGTYDFIATKLNATNSYALVSNASNITANGSTIPTGYYTITGIGKLT